MADYDKFAPYYDLEYGHKDNDLDFYLEIANRFGGPILEVGVGTGRVAMELAQKGHVVHGIDNSSGMLKVAQEKIENMKSDFRSRIQLTPADMSSFDLSEQFSLCIIPFRAFLHNLTIDDQLQTLENIRKHLRPNSYLVFDLFVPLYHIMANDIWHDKIDQHELSVEDSDISIDIKIEHQPAEQLLTIQNSYRDSNSAKTHHAVMKYRYIFRYEMEALLRCVGYTVIDVYGGFEKQPYDYKSGIMVFVAQVASG